MSGQELGSSMGSSFIMEHRPAVHFLSYCCFVTKRENLHERWYSAQTMELDLMTLWPEMIT